MDGAEEDRTPDLIRARDALSQLSYRPETGLILSPGQRAVKEKPPVSVSTEARGLSFLSNRILLQ